MSNDVVLRFICHHASVDFNVLKCNEGKYSINREHNSRLVAEARLLRQPLLRVTKFPLKLSEAISSEEKLPSLELYLVLD